MFSLVRVAVAALVVSYGCIAGLSEAKAAVYVVSGLGLDATITTDASNNVVSITGTVGTYGADTLSPGAILGVIGGPVAEIGGGTNLAPIDNLFLPSAPYFTSTGGIAFSFVNQNSNLIGAGLWYDSPGVYELFIGNWLSDRKGELSVTAVPEPSTWAMLLIGFAGLGFVARRRWQRGEAATA